jgi:histidinol-phosphate aminotransferase
MVIRDSARLRAELQTFPPYVPGRAPEEVAGLTPYRLSSNENHLDPLPAVLEALAQPGDLPTRYPDDAAVALRKRIGEVFGVSPDRTIVTAGASELLVALTQITSDNRTEAVYPWPSFEMYSQVTGLAGAKRHEVPLQADGRHDLAAMISAVTPATGIVFLCSPNNPTGPVLTHDELVGLLYAVPSHVLVVLDEAYWEFATDPQAARGIDLLDEHPNLVLARTFSKAHGLAGLRVGYAIAHEDVIAGLLKAVIPFGVTQPSQRAAAVSLDHHDEVLARAREIAAVRDDFAEALRDQGWTVPQAQGNFVWLPLGELSDDFELAASRQALSVRNLGAGVRISVGPDEALERVLELSRTFLAENPQLQGEARPSKH